MTSWARVCALLTCCALACGQGASDGGQTGGEDFSCSPTPYMAVELDEVTSGGFSAAQVLETVGTARTATLRYADGSTTTLTFEFELVGPAQSAAGCKTVQIPMRVDAASADGAWSAQARSITFSSTSTMSASFALMGEASSFGLDLARFDVAKHASYDLSVLVSFGKHDAFGSVAVVGHDPNQDDTSYRLGTIEAP